MDDEILDMIDQCELHSDALSDRQARIIDDFGTRETLTPKQRALLESIYNEVFGDGNS